MLEGPNVKDHSSGARRRCVNACILLWLLPVMLAAGEQSFERDIEPIFKTYCIQCHGPQKQKGGVNLSTFKNYASVLRDPRLAETVLKQFRDREMPPDGKPQPKPEERDRAVAWFENTLKNLDAGNLPRDPGRVMIHRLSRTEYNNTIRDLFGVTTQPANSFPADGSGGGGFDNNADTLFVPPILMEKYLDTATDILDAADPVRLFVDRPETKTPARVAAWNVVAHHASRAFRRPVENSEMNRLMTLYDGADKRGAKFEDSVKFALKGVLVSPTFLFRAEADQPGTEPYRVSDYELASRLSYFIWSSMPDEELLTLAAQKRLRDPQVLETQVKRMIQDKKSRALAEDFAGQWLGVNTLKNGAPPDPKRFPKFTPALRDYMVEETVEFFHGLLRDDASLLNLIDCDYAIINEPLAWHYQIPDIKGTEFRKVKLADSNRGGLLGMGAVLTLTSYPQRTSPVLRGKWVLDELLGTPPPPPPPNVGVLPPDDFPKDGLSFRQRLEEHRKKAECASCHKRMDPIGFGLENYDSTGEWRTQIANAPVDASGVLVNGEKFNGAAELKKKLMLQKDVIIRNLSEKMLSYSLGRGLEYYDVPAVKKIATEVSRNSYRSSVLIAEVVKSFPFQYRRNAPIGEVADATPKTPKVDAAKPDVAKPDAKPPAAKPDVAKTDAKKTPLPKTDVAKDKPAAPKSDAAKPPAAKPDASKPPAAKPEPAKPKPEPAKQKVDGK